MYQLNWSIDTEEEILMTRGVRPSSSTSKEFVGSEMVMYRLYRIVSKYYLTLNSLLFTLTSLFNLCSTFSAHKCKFKCNLSHIEPIKFIDSRFMPLTNYLTWLKDDDDDVARCRDGWGWDKAIKLIAYILIMWFGSGVERWWASRPCLITHTRELQLWIWISGKLIILSN